MNWKNFLRAGSDVSQHPEGERKRAKGPLPNRTVPCSSRNHGTGTGFLILLPDIYLIAGNPDHFDAP